MRNTREGPTLQNSEPDRKLTNQQNSSIPLSFTISNFLTKNFQVQNDNSDRITPEHARQPEIYPKRESTIIPWSARICARSTQTQNTDEMPVSRLKSTNNPFPV